MKNDPIVAEIREIRRQIETTEPFRAREGLHFQTSERADFRAKDGVRYCSSELGRWLSRDPIGERGGLNVYGFCDQDPLSAYDAFGERVIHRRVHGDSMIVYSDLGGVQHYTFDREAMVQVEQEKAAGTFNYGTPIDLNVLGSHVDAYRRAMLPGWTFSYTVTPIPPHSHTGASTFD